jgi:hypothetical protein
MAGFYLQAEASSWPNQSTTLGDGKPFDQYLYEETERMLEQYGNHPSFIMMAHGNEPGGPKHREFLARYVSHWKSEDPRRLYVSGAGWPNIPENDYMNDPAPVSRHGVQDSTALSTGNHPGVTTTGLNTSRALSAACGKP